MSDTLARCSIEGCDRAHHARTWCNTHYVRWRKYGDALVVHQQWDLVKPVLKYISAHDRVYRVRGRARDQACQHCGAAAKDWAYDHKDPNELTEEWYGRTVAYSVDPDHYLPLCRRCHRRFDRVHDGDES